MYTFSPKRDTSSLLTVFLVLIALFLTGCASTQVNENEVTAEVVDADEQDETDPYEGFNRSMYDFNEGLDDYVAAPISDAYLWVTPQFVQTGIANFFYNLQDINVVLNDVMQGKLAQGAEDTGRFAVNTTLGLFGLFDVATEFGLDKHEEDFAQTLAVWGVPQGPYLVLPVLGPSTGRGVPGGIFDAAANPATYVGAPITLLQMLNARANAEGALNFIDEAALDPYIFTREAFLQHRKHLITDGESEITGDLLDLEDDFYDEDEELFVDNEQTESQEIVVKESAIITVTAIDESIKNKESELLITSGNEDEEFSQASSSFDGAVKSFDAAAQSFEEAAAKLDRLEKQN